MFLFVLAERRAQLARSRSRQNIFQGQSPDIVREIKFDNDSTLVDSPVSRTQRKGRNRRHPGAEIDESFLNHNSAEESYLPKQNGSVPKSSHLPTGGAGEGKVVNGGSGMSEAEELLQRLKAL